MSDSRLERIREAGQARLAALRSEGITTEAGLISRLVADAIRDLDAYTGNNKRRYDDFRESKRALYQLRPDLAPGLLRFINSQTHWNEAASERREQSAHEAEQERLYQFQEERRERQRAAQEEFLRYEVSRSTVNRWLRDGLGPKSWANAIEALQPDAKTLKRWERSGIPEDNLRTLEKGAARVEPDLEAPDFGDVEETDETPGDDYDLSEEYDTDYWDDIVETYEDEGSDFAQFEKLS